MNREERERLGGHKGLKRRAYLEEARENATAAYNCFARAFSLITSGCVSELPSCSCAYSENPTFVQDSFDDAETRATMALEFLKKAHKL